MWEEIYIWIEQYAGTSYDLTENINELRGDAIFISPTIWRNNLSIVLERLSDMIDVINEYWPTGVPS